MSSKYGFEEEREKKEKQQKDEAEAHNQLYEAMKPQVISVLPEILEEYLEANDISTDTKFSDLYSTVEWYSPGADLKIEFDGNYISIRQNEKYDDFIDMYNSGQANSWTKRTDVRSINLPVGLEKLAETLCKNLGIKVSLVYNRPIITESYMILDERYTLDEDNNVKKVRQKIPRYI